MGRLTRDQQKVIKDKFGVDRLWSYSRWSCFSEHPWEYRMKYLEGNYTDGNIYTVFGTISHDTIQDFYDGKYAYEEMINVFNEKVMEWRSNPNGMKFLSDKSEDDYISSLEHYFQNTEVVPFKIRNELPILYRTKYAKTGDPLVFIGYVDSIYKDDDGITHLVDYKTSTDTGFTGKNLKEKSRQLLLYAMAVSQRQGIPLETMNLRFDMMKYVNVEFKMKDKVNSKGGITKEGNWKPSRKLRTSWVSKSENNIRKALTWCCPELDVIEIDELVDKAIEEESLDCLPEIARSRFKLSNCYIDVPVTQEDVDDLDELLGSSCQECIELEASDNLEEAFPEPVIDYGNKFYYEQLSGLLHLHQGYQAQQRLHSSATDISDDDIDDLFS